ncbi:MAG: hypothetical protein ABFQ95_06860, partial [Pseudomonadota bacterium]
GLFTCWKFGFLPTETTLFAYLKFSLPTQNAKEPKNYQPRRLFLIVIAQLAQFVISDLGVLPA